MAVIHNIISLLLKLNYNYFNIHKNHSHKLLHVAIWFKYDTNSLNSIKFLQLYK